MFNHNDAQKFNQAVDNQRNREINDYLRRRRKLEEEEDDRDEEEDEGKDNEQ